MFAAHQADRDFFESDGLLGALPQVCGKSMPQGGKDGGRKKGSEEFPLPDAFSSSSFRRPSLFRSAGRKGVTDKRLKVIARGWR